MMHRSHGWSISELEEMYPFEMDVYVGLLMMALEEEEKKRRESRG